MENETNTNTNKKNSSAIVWVIIGILVLVAIIVLIITTVSTETRPQDQIQDDPIIGEIDDEGELNNEILDDSILDEYDREVIDLSEPFYDENTVFNMQRLRVSNEGWSPETLNLSYDRVVILTITTTDINCDFEIKNTSGLETSLSANTSEDLLFNTPPVGEYYFSCVNIIDLPKGKIIVE